MFQRKLDQIEDSVLKRIEKNPRDCRRNYNRLVRLNDWLFDWFIFLLYTIAKCLNHVAGPTCLNTLLVLLVVIFLTWFWIFSLFDDFSSLYGFHYFPFVLFFSFLSILVTYYRNYIILKLTCLFFSRECLLIDPKEHPMLLAEPSSNAQQQRERYSGCNLSSRFNGALFKTSTCIIQLLWFLQGSRAYVWEVQSTCIIFGKKCCKWTVLH